MTAAAPGPQTAKNLGSPWGTAVAITGATQVVSPPSRGFLLTADGILRCTLTDGVEVTFTAGTFAIQTEYSGRIASIHADTTVTGWLLS